MNQAKIEAQEEQNTHQERMLKDIVYVLKIFRDAINNESIDHLAEVELLLDANKGS